MSGEIGTLAELEVAGVWVVAPLLNPAVAGLGRTGDEAAREVLVTGR
jgi:hypothetical protein